MATFERAPKSVEHMAKSLLEEFDSHADLRNCGAVIDFVFAHAEADDDGNLKGHALMRNGVRALGIARKLPLKDRAMGRGDAEISIDADWWAEANEAQQRALLDHELHHLYPKIDKRGVVLDDLRHPVIMLRKHDFDFGWFNIIAERHKGASLECRQAKAIMDATGQLYFPEFTKTLKGTDTVTFTPAHVGGALKGSTVTIKTNGMKPVTVSGEQFSRAAAILKAKA